MTKKVLIADDEPIIRADLKEILEDLGYEVVAEAGDGLEALNLIERRQKWLRKSSYTT